MSTNKQRREAARRKLERQLVTRQERARRRRQTNVIASVVGTLVVIAVIITFIVFTNNDKTKPAASASSSTAATTATTATSTSAAPVKLGLPARTPPARAAAKPKKTSGPCGYNETAANVASKTDFQVGLPPDPKPTPAKGVVNVKVVTTRGEVDIALDRADAPCAVQSWVYLIQKKFYDASPCHRLVNSGIFVLQCGDPTGTGTGGPTYQYKEENLKNAQYTSGVVAMAKETAAGTTSGQFFIMYKNSTSLPKQYSVVGKVTKGLSIVQAVGAGGLASDQTAPKIPIGIRSMRIV